MLFKNRRLILLFFFGVLVVVGLATFLATPTYEVTVAVLVKKARGDVPLAPTQSTQLIIGQVTEEDLNSEIEILKSRHLIEEVLVLLGIDENAAPRDESILAGSLAILRRPFDGMELSYFNRTVLELQEELKFELVRGSNIVEIKYRSEDPRWATAFLQALTERYLERRTQIYQVPQAVAFFDEQTTAARERLTNAESALEQYLQTSGVSIPLDSQKQAVLNRLSQFEVQLASAEVDVQAAEDTVAALEARLSTVPERLASADRFNLDPEVEEIQKGLVALHLRRDALVQDYGPDNRKVKDMDEQIRLAEELLANAESRLGDINRTEINQVHQTLKTQLLSAQAQLEGARGRHASLGARVTEFRQERDDLDQKGFELDRLQRDVEASEETYLLYVKKHEEARISSAMDQQKMVNVSVAREAVQPLEPVTPRKRLNMALALVLGTIGGLGVALGKEYFDHTISTGEDLERGLGIVHLASIPEDKT